MRRLNSWPITAGIASLVVVAYIALCTFAPLQLLPYLIAFGLLFVLLIWMNPKRRYFRLGSAAVGLLLMPFIASSLIHFEISDLVFLHLVASEPGTAYYISGTLIALTCLALDAAINSDSPFRLVIDKFELLSRFQVAIGGNVTQTLVENNTGHVTINAGTHYWGDSSGIHAEITSAAQKTQDGKPDVAIALLSPLLAKVPGDDKRSRYRIHANLGYAHLERDDVHAAVVEFQKAIQYESGTEDSCGIAALAAFISGNDIEAHDIAAEALRKFPSSSRALSVFIQTAPLNYTPVDFSDIVKPPSDKDVEVLYALSRRYNEQHRFSDSLGLARKAVGQLPESPRLLEHLASTILNKEGVTFREHKVAGGPRPDSAAIAEAISIYTALISKSEHLTAATLSRIHHRIAMCNWLGGNAAAAEKHFATALNLNPRAEDARRHFVQFEVERGDLKSAIDHLRLVPSGDEPVKDRLLLAELLYATQDPQNELEAFAILRDNIAQLATADSQDKSEWLGLLCQCSNATDNGEWLELERDRILSFSSKPWMSSAFEAECSLSRNQPDKAVAALRSWVGLLGADDNVMQRQWCARLCQKAGAHDLALQAWKPVAVASPNWPYWHHVLDCAVRSEDDDFILTYCEKLRLNDCLDPHCLHAELDALGKYHEDAKAIEVIHSYVDRIVDDDLRRLMEVRKSLFAIRCGRLALVSTDESRLPRAESVDEEGGVWTVEILRKSGLRERAVKFGYTLLRRFGRNPDVNKVFVAAFDFGAPDIRPDTDCVVVDDAVQYQEDDTEQLRWIIIESSLTGELAENEADPEHVVSKALLGKKKGDRVILRPDDIQPRTATIKELRSKYAYRAVDIIENWETRFHGDHFVKKYIAGKNPDGSPDVSAMLRTFQAMSADEEVIRQSYINKPLGISLYCRMRHVTHIQAAYLLGQDSETPIRCSTGDSREMEEAVSHVGAKKVVVTDPSSLATIFVTGFFESIERLPEKVLLTQSSLISVHEELERVNSGRTPMGYMRSTNGRVQFVDHDEQSHAQYVRRLKDFLDWLEANSEPRGGSSASKLPRSTRDQMEELFGSAYVESACLAKEVGGVHWTDDLTVAWLLDQQLEVARCWTQSYLAAMLSRSSISEHAVQSIVVELLRFGFEQTYWSSSVVIAAGKSCEWRWTHRPLKAIVAFAEQGDPRAVVGLIVQLCLDVQNEPLVTSKMEEFLIAIMRRASERKDGKFLLATIGRELNLAFGINVSHAQWARDLVIHAQQTTSASRLIIP